MNIPVVLITGALRGIGSATALGVSRRLLAAVALSLVRVFIAYEYPGDVSFALRLE
jgi:NAD(P)-dependent dehydrogenase (short-subunit alcohol dehydrogenase family)